ncbi:hypothetical protein AHMF7605_11960 [Adhaeribacter arboris]|uniref:DNA (cytosine-5-)-methyltransferase n=1 Tax=Adhaeribacter arboris TaxID=2072846 RepID=A0A2T2YF87_9BACT|nr:DNA cytosine methyltransferase [Adhaeribacter arboris]PSR54186.1 hypothetical protein AHMF7605_11960 [Adhaeribacter arboris]
MTHGALFNGIAGFPLAAAWAGIPTSWTVEIDEFCNKQSKRHFPDAIQFTDIRTASNLPYVDIISGGDPCQPHSVSGKKKGEADIRYLWPEMYCIVKETRPNWVINENVTGSILNGVLDTKISNLEDANYTCWPPLIIPASAIGAFHQRKRVWLIAYSNAQRRKRVLHNNPRSSIEETRPEYPLDSQGNAFLQFEERVGQPAVFGFPHGISDAVAQLAAYGNAIDPRIAYEIFKAIMQLEKSGEEYTGGRL